MNIRQAILAAADHIERNPHEFNFDSCAVPSHPHCGSPGCAIGWIACFMGEAFPRDGVGWLYESNPLGVKDGEFYDRMTDLSLHWINRAKDCASALRKYADKYHPEAPIKFPDWNALAHQPVPAQGEV